ncbi:MAG TPA: glycosyltransferase family 39 protein [Lacunisphaera sp.]|nr:glycosyltransferase family 39 protein [Lacunisphaera sp.]
MTASPGKGKVARTLGVLIIVGLGLYLRFVAALAQPLWVDEAESAINALTILEHGLPVSHYLGLPLYENTLTESWPESREYEFRDSSYSPKGLAVYHGWLPLYAIAAAQALAGISPDRADSGEAPRVRHDDASVRVRTLAPRVPALIFSLGFMVLIYRLASEMAGNAAGFGALVWAAVSERAVLYGHQARYYSLTLLLCALFLHVYLRVHRQGRVRDFVLLGVVTGLLFHTHQLSAVVACVAALAGLPRIMRHAHWLKKGLLTAGIVALAVLPWAVLSGFFSTLSRVPKVFTLFREPADWFQYVLHHAGPAAIGAAGFALILGLTSRSPERSVSGERASLRGQATILLAWTVLCLVAFHTLVPAASYFTGRLTLMLLTPYLILVSVAIGLICDRVAPRRAVALSVAGVLLLLALIGEADLKTKRLPESRKIEPALGALRALRTKSDDRFYAPPNEHLVWTYYSGLPVQSIAPVRKTYLDGHPGRIVVLERRFHDAFATPRQIQAAAQTWGQAVTPDQVEALRFDLWRRQMTGFFLGRGFSVEAAPVLPEFMDEVAAAVADLSRRSAAAQMRYYAGHPVFKGIACADPAEQWLAFFYRFANPETRLGVNANAYNRLRRAEVTLVPAAALAIYVSPYPSSSGASVLSTL